MKQLNNKRIVLGLTGGIACYKTAEYLRRAQDEGATIEVVMTASAQRFITPATLQALAGRPVWTDLWDERSSNLMPHINLSRDADAIVVAPASTNFIARLAHGMADDLLSTLCVARGDCPLLLAPAMNREMWLHPATQRNVTQVQADGAVLLGPASGDQACGETGTGRMLEPAELLAETIAFFQAKVLAGQRVLITAGPTSEPIDPVRVISNRSSGKMGYAMARAAREAGAAVTLISGPTALACPYGVERISVKSALDMYEAVLAHTPQTDIFISVAAVADWRVKNPSPRKLKKDEHSGLPTLDFVANPDILAEVAALNKAPFCVGFAAETDDLRAHAQAKRARKRIPMIIGNLAQDTMDADDVTLTIFTHEHEQTLPRQDKLSAARSVIHHIAQHAPSSYSS